VDSARVARVEMFEQKPETKIGLALYEELLWVHSMIRRDLATVRKLALDVVNTMPAHEIAEEIKHLKRDGKLWQLKMGCLRYCRFVHSHHNLEDAAFFPSLRAVNPALNPVVDKLEDDHRKVSDLLDAVEEGADILTKVDSDAVRRTVGDTLTVLGERLLEHLDYEELNVGPSLKRMHGIDGITR
jgi:glycerol-3-phosphate dehydrogenase